MIGDDDLVAVVRAYSFELVNPETGDVVAELEVTVDNLNALTFHHGGGLDSSLNWNDLSSVFTDPAVVNLDGPGGQSQIAQSADRGGAAASITARVSPGVGTPVADLVLDWTPALASARLNADDGGPTPATLELVSNGSARLDASTTIVLDSGTTITLDAGTTLALIAAGAITVTPTGALNLNPGGNIVVNGRTARTVFSSGTSIQGVALGLAAGNAALAGTSTGAIAFLAGDTIKLDATAHFVNAGAISSANLIIVRNGAVILNPNPGATHTVGAGGASTVHFAITDSPGAGNFTYQLFANQTGGAWTAAAGRGILTWMQYGPR